MMNFSNPDFNESIACECQECRNGYKNKKTDMFNGIDFDMAKAISMPDHDIGRELAQAYVPFQKAGNIYSPDEGLVKGTIFPELYRPYKPCHNHGY